MVKTDVGTLEEVKEVYSGLEDILSDSSNLLKWNIKEMTKMSEGALAGMLYLGEKYEYNKGFAEYFLKEEFMYGLIRKLRWIGYADILFAGEGYLGYFLYNAGAHIAGLTLSFLAAVKFASLNGTYVSIYKNGSKSAKKLLKMSTVYSYFKKKGIEGIKDFLKNPLDDAFQIDNKMFLSRSIVSTAYLASAIELVNKGNVYLTALGALMGAYGVYTATKTGYLFAKMRNKLKH